MEFRKALLSAVAGAALIGFAGGAYAAGDDDKAPSTLGSGAASPGETVPPPGGAIMPSTPTDRPGAEQLNKKGHPPGFIVGKPLLNPQGDKIGTVSKIEGDNVIVSVGGFLGIGSHDVSLAWNQLRLSGMGDNAKLWTTLTQDELKALPEYEEPKSGGIRTSPSGSMGGAAAGDSRTAR